jgi:peptide/nickel transport system substrate-binding protein
MKSSKYKVTKATEKKDGINRRTFLKRAGVSSLSLLALSGLKGNSVLGAEENPRFIAVNPSEINSMDPADHYDVARSMARLNFYDGLVRWRGNPPRMELWLAEAFEGSSDAKKWTYRLRKGAKFHNGDEVTAEDVVYSLERLLGLGTGSGGLFKSYVEPGTTRALGRYGVEFNLKQSFAPFPSITHDIYILNQRVLKKHEKDGDWGNKWLAVNGTHLGEDGVGTGSYTVESYDPSRGFDGIKFKDHFRAWDHPHMEKIGLRTVHETASRILGLMKGDYHAEVGYLPYDQIEKIKGSPEVRIIVEPSMRLFYCHFHHLKAPTSDLHVRRGICHAFDYKSWVHDVMHDMVERNIGPVPRPMWGSLKPEDMMYDYDLDKAKAEFAKAEVDIKKYEPITQLIHLGFPTLTEGSQLLQAGLNKIGVKTKIEALSWPQCAAIMADQEKCPPISWIFQSTMYPDPDNWSRLLSKKYWGTIFGASFYTNPQVEQLLEQANSVPDRKKREPLIRQALLIGERDAAQLNVHNEKWTGTVSKNLEGVRFCPVGDMNEYRWLYWKKA